VSNVKMSSSLGIDNLPGTSIHSWIGFRLVLNPNPNYLLWHLYFLLMPKRKYQRKGPSFRQRQRPAGIALFLTGMSSFFGKYRRISSCQKRRSLLRRDHPLRSGVPRGWPVPEPGDFAVGAGIRDFLNRLSLNDPSFQPKLL